MELNIHIPSQDTPERLFHYCSSESLFKIIESQKLWLSSAKYSHDPDEIRIVKKILESRMEIETGEFKKFITDLLLKYTVYEDGLTPFIFCLSEEFDDLSQWRYYSNDGKGFLIGLKTKYLPHQSIWDYVFPNPESGHSVLKGFFIDKVIYNSNEQSNLINQLIDIIQLSYKALSEEQLYSFALKLLLISSVFKSQHYNKENEWRLIFFPIKMFPPKSDDNYFYRYTNNAIIPYLEYDIVLDAESTDIPVSDILIGPCNKSEISEIDRFALRKYKHWRINSTQKSNINYLGK